MLFSVKKNKNSKPHKQPIHQGLGEQPEEQAIFCCWQGPKAIQDGVSFAGFFDLFTHLKALSLPNKSWEYTICMKPYAAVPIQT